METASTPKPHRSLLVLLSYLSVLVLIAELCGCGGGASSAPPPPPPPPFQPRAFPGDFFITLPPSLTEFPTPGVAYDQALKEIFVSNPNFNSVDVYSTVDGHRVGEVAIPGPAGLAFSPDFSKLYAGTITPYVYVVDPIGLHVSGQITVPASFLVVSGIASSMAVQPYPMADGSVILGMGYTSQSSQSPDNGGLLGVLDLVRYDPANGTFTSVDPGPKGVSSSPSRTLDGKLLFVYGVGSAGPQLLLYSSAIQGYLPVSAQSPNGAILLAANADGSKFSVVDDTSNVLFFDENLQLQAQYSSPRALGSEIFSQDGKSLYLTNDLNYVTVLDTQSATPAFYFGVSLGSNRFPTPLVGVDETTHTFGLTPGGAYIVDASHGQSTPPTVVPDFYGLGSSQASPEVGPLAGGTQVQFAPAPLGAGSADGIASSMQAYFGATPATNDAVAPYASSSDGENALTATTPPAKNPGPVSVVLTDANNNTVLLPDAFTYGPHILGVQPNTAVAGDQVTIYAYGLSSSTITATIGGYGAGIAILDLNAGIDYPVESITVTVPSGVPPGWADVVVKTSNGSDTLQRGMQYLKQESEISAGQFAFAAYDGVRDVFYLTGGGNSVAVFNPNTLTFESPLQSTSISAGAILQQLTLTPDNSKLLVVDPQDLSVIVFDLAGGTNKAVSVSLASDPEGIVVEPITVVATANNRAFVSVVPCVTDPVRQIDLTNFHVTGRPDGGFSCGTYVTYPEYGSASADGSTVIYAGSSGVEFGLEPSGPEYIWIYNAASDTFSGPVIVADTPWLSGLAALDGDGGVAALSQGVLDQNLLPAVPIVQPASFAQLNQTGSLHYGTSGGSPVSISDTRHGRLQLQMMVPFIQSGPPVPIIGVAQPLAVSPSGSKILGALSNGVAYFQLSVVPLAVASVSPATVPSGGMVQLRGSGFIAGMTVTIGGAPAACAVVDSETLSCTVPNVSSGTTEINLTNPDGQTYLLESALIVQ